MPKLLTQYRVFIGSPGGLEEERACFRRKLAKFTEMHSEPYNVAFQPVGWEETIGGVGRPQELINEDLKQCDYAVFVLHDRWGSPTGVVYTSGVEEEWAHAVELYEANTVRNIALFFKKVDPRQLGDPGKQLLGVLAFKKQIEEQKRYLFRQYDTLDQFAEALEAHLARWLRDHESAATGLSVGGLPTTGTAMMGTAASPPLVSPGFGYWIAEAIKLSEPGTLDYNAALFCARKAIDEATSDIEWARARNVAGIAQFHLGKADEAITAFATIAARFSVSIDADRRYWQVKALVNKGITLGNLGRTEDAIAVYDDLLARFGTATELLLREQVATALVGKGFTLDKLGRSEDAIAVYDDVVARFGTATELPLREQVAKALVNKGISARRARPQRGGDRGLRRCGGAVRRGRRAAVARTGRQGARQQGGQARRARPQRGGDRRLRRRGRSVRHGRRAAAARTGRQGAAARDRCQLDAGGRDCGSTTCSPVRRTELANGRQRCQQGDRARPLARRGRIASRRPARPVRHGDRAAAARTGRQGARQQGGHARHARPQRGRDCRLRRPARPGSARRPRRCANRSPRRSSTRESRSARSAAARTRLPSTTTCSPGSARRPSCRCANRSPRRSSTRGSRSARSAAARRRSPSTTTCSRGSARRPSCRCANRSPRLSSTRGSRSAQLGRSEDAIAVYDDLLARFGTATELPLREQVAKALVDKGVTLGTLGRSEEAIAVYDDLLARFGTATELPLRERVAKALFSKGVTLDELGRSEDAIAVFDDLLARFGTATELREQVANALVSKGVALDKLGRSEDAIAVFDDLLARFGTATELREQVANALVNKGVALDKLGRSEDAIAVYDDLLARFGTATDRCANRSPTRSSARGHARQARPHRGRDCGLRRSARQVRHGDRTSTARTDCDSRIP